MVRAPEEREALTAAVAALSRMRLMACGSAALPDSVLSSWEELTGYRLLERYGMTEMGMALSNPYKGHRKQGSVGQPLPNVTCRLVDDNGQEVGEGPGELRVKGPNMFREYLNRADATAESFDEQGWFKTGDIAQLEDGYYKILGRNSTDIIKVS
jgi:malonyl-CoA/methylmalonyl-CoA synthetase